MFDPRGWLAKEYFVTAHLLKSFRQHIDVLPRSLQQMWATWERIYPGVDSDLSQRFNDLTQLGLLENWSRLVDYAHALHGKLAHRIEKTSGELLNLRNSVSMTDTFSQHSMERRRIPCYIADSFAADARQGGQHERALSFQWEQGMGHDLICARALRRRKSDR